jgi:hypothetical protein
MSEGWRLVEDRKQNGSEDHRCSTAGGLSQEWQYTSAEKRFLKNWAQQQAQE